MILMLWLLLMLLNSLPNSTPLLSWPLSTLLVVHPSNPVRPHKRYYPTIVKQRKYSIPQKKPVLKALRHATPHLESTKPLMVEPETSKTTVNDPNEEVIEEITDSNQLHIQQASKSQGFYSIEYPVTDRILDHYTARTGRRLTLLTMINHRNYQAVLRDPWNGFLGFDGGGLKVGLGLRFSILDNLDIGILRMNGTIEIYDTYELDARCQVFDQQQYGLDLTLRAGISYFPQVNHQDAMGYLAAITADHLFWDRWLLGGGVIFHSNSSNPFKGNEDKNYSVGFYSFSEIRIIGSLSLDIEVTANVGGYRAAPYPVITFGPRFITNRHTFALELSNSQFFTSDGIITNTVYINPSDWILGFHITREISFQ